MNFKNPSPLSSLMFLQYVGLTKHVPQNKVHQPKLQCYTSLVIQYYTQKAVQKLEQFNAQTTASKFKTLKQQIYQKLNLFI